MAGKSASTIEKDNADACPHCGRRAATTEQDRRDRAIALTEAIIHASRMGEGSVIWPLAYAALYMCETAE
jgi:hypothetical protein